MDGAQVALQGSKREFSARYRASVDILMGVCSADIRAVFDPMMGACTRAHATLF